MRLGFQKVNRIRVCESLLPEHAVEFRPVTAPMAASAEWPAYRVRPVRLIDPPMRIEVSILIPGESPVQFFIGDRKHRIVRCEGPERLTAEWWRTQTSCWGTRDYYRIEDDKGFRFWIFHDPSGHWFLHGHLPYHHSCAITRNSRYRPTSAFCGEDRILRSLGRRPMNIGHYAIALTDRNTLSGIVLAHSTLKKTAARHTRFIVGCRLDLSSGESILCYPTNRKAYGNLTQLLTLGRRRANKGSVYSPTCRCCGLCGRPALRSSFSAGSHRLRKNAYSTLRRFVSRKSPSCVDPLLSWRR